MPCKACHVMSCHATLWYIMPHHGTAGRGCTCEKGAHVDPAALVAEQAVDGLVEEVVHPRPEVRHQTHRALRCDANATTTTMISATTTMTMTKTMTTTENKQQGW